MEVEVTVNPQDVNNVVGYKQENISKLKELYDVDLIVTPDENIKQGKSKIEVTKTFEFQCGKCDKWGRFLNGTKIIVTFKNRPQMIQ